MPYAVVVTFAIHSDHWDAFLPLIHANAKASVADEVGCLQFDVATDPDRPDEVFLYEVYADAAAFQTHLQSVHFKDFDTTAGHMIADKTVTTYAQVTQ